MRILVFRIGFLGDTLVAIPALTAIRAHFAGAHIDYLSEDNGAPGFVSPRDVLPAEGLVDRFITFANRPSERWGKSWFSLYWKVSSGRYDALVYLPPSRRTAKQIRRDLLFFRLAGINQIYGIRKSDRTVGYLDYSKSSEHETDYLLRHLASQSIVLPANLRGKTDIYLSSEEKAFADRWLNEAAVPAEARSLLLAVGPGGKMPAKRWPVERYELVVRELIKKCNVWPIVLGGKEDAMLGRNMINTWGRGSLAAGAVSVRQAASLLARCLVYLGNDTGTMHLAAAAGIPCVALFSARDVPGRWDPYGTQHRVLRHRVVCEGCMLEVCDRGDECLKKIGTDEVIAACSDLIRYRTSM